ncbi:hypothetical protein [Actinomycetospora sp. NBC_00405]
MEQGTVNGVLEHPSLDPPGDRVDLVHELTVLVTRYLEATPA